VRVTGVITCRNYSDLVGGAIDSFARQAHEPRSLVVIDDGSADDSWDVIRRRANDESPCPIEIFRVETPQGQAYAKNFAIMQAWDYTDAFAFLDADDRYEPGFLSRTASALDGSHGHPGLAYSDHRIVDLTCDLTHDRFHRSFSPEALRDGHVPDGDFVVLREAIQVIGRFDEALRVAENFDLILRLSRKFMPIHIPEILVTTHLTTRSLRKSLPASDWESYRKMAVDKHGKTT
jgi:O-antigen biosynthesis protein